MLNISFALMNFAIAIWNLGDIFVALSNTTIQALFWDRISYISAIIIIPSLIGVVLSIIGISKKQIKITLSIINIFGFLLAILVFTPLIIKDVTINPLQEITGSLFFLFIIYFVSGMGYALYSLFSAYKNVTSIKKMQIKYLGYGLFVDLIAVCIYFLALYYQNIPPLYYFIEFIGSAIWAYAIVRYHLMDINIVIKRTVLYGILTTLISGFYVGLIFLFEYLSQKTFGYSSLFIRIFAGFIIAISFIPFRSRIEILIDRVFYRTKYDHQKTLLDFSQSLTSILELRQLLDLITRVIVSTLKVDKTSIMLWNKELKQYTIMSAVGLPDSHRRWQFDEKSKFISYLVKEKKIILRSDFQQKALSHVYFDVIAEMRLLKSVVAIPFFHKQELIGILNIGQKLSGELFTQDDLELLKTLSSEASIAIANANLYNELEKYYLQTVNALAQAIETSDVYTRGHSDRVSKSALKVAKLLGLSRKEIEHLKYACILHDIGKIGIRKEILNKNGKLSIEEFDHIKTHTVKGEEIIAPVAFLKKVRPIIRHHHERFDGAGYPDGLSGEDIPILARIISIADTFDAITSNRPYRGAQTDEFAMNELKKHSGHQFDPKIIKIFIESVIKI